MLRIFERTEPGYEETLTSLSRRGDEDLARVEPDVRAILDSVRERGDEAVLDYTERFDGRRPAQLVVPRETWLEAARQVDPAVRDALEAAGERIRRYHEHQRDTGFRYEEGGIELGQRVQPVAAAAVYAPGGKARYPSTVLMTAIPATVAGVKRIVLVTPNPTPEILAAAVVAAESGRCTLPVDVHCASGDFLTIDGEMADGVVTRVSQTGPACVVYEGVLEVDDALLRGGSR